MDGTSEFISADKAYAILGLLRGASHREIRRAYLRLSIRHHPDKQSDAAADPTAFLEISKAYQTLLSHRVAQFDREQVEREQAINKDIEAAEAELAKLEESFRQKNQELAERERHAYELRQEKRKQAEGLHFREAFEKYAKDRPPAVEFQGRLFLCTGSGRSWEADDGSYIYEEFPYRPGYSDWYVRLQGKVGFYRLRDSPYPFNSAVKGKFVWADWEFVFYSGRGTRVSRFAKNNRAVFKNELRQRKQKEEAHQQDMARQQQEKDKQERLRKKRELEQQEAERKRRRKQRWTAIDALAAKAKRREAPLMLEYQPFGSGTKLATAKNRKDQLTKQNALLTLLRRKWSQGKDDESLRAELVRVRCTLHHNIHCDGGFWDRVEASGNEFTRTLTREEERSALEARDAIESAKALKCKTQEDECELLMKLYPDARNVEVRRALCRSTAALHLPYLAHAAAVCMSATGGSQACGACLGSPQESFSRPKSYRIRGGRSACRRREWGAGHCDQSVVKRSSREPMAVQG